MGVAIPLVQMVDSLYWTGGREVLVTMMLRCVEVLVATEEPPENGEVESDDRQNWNDDGPEDEEENVADEIRLRSFPSHVTLEVTRTVLILDQPNRKEGEGGEQGAAEGLAANHPSRQWNRDEG